VPTPRLTAGLLLLVLALPANAGTIAADALPLPNRVAGADAIVVGKVTAFEDRPVIVAPKTEYKIAVVTVSNALLAPKGTMTVRIGFVPPPPMVAINPPPFVPVLGQEGCFFLSKHEAADFYVVNGQLSFLDKKRDSFDKDVALIQRCTKLLQEPNAALKSKDVDDRFLTAAMLVAQYRTRRSAKDRLEPIDAEQSKRILQALAAADWTPAKDFTQLSPLMVLHKLPLTAKDGWMPPRDANAYPAYAQNWVREHVDSYRIQRFVADKSK
jgi:hypothetical protein